MRAQVPRPTPSRAQKMRERSAAGATDCGARSERAPALRPCAAWRLYRSTERRQFSVRAPMPRRARPNRPRAARRVSCHVTRLLRAVVSVCVRLRKRLHVAEEGAQLRPRRALAQPARGRAPLDELRRQAARAARAMSARSSAF